MLPVPTFFDASKSWGKVKEFASPQSFTGPKGSKTGNNLES